jgi:hypothetical protein
MNDWWFGGLDKPHDFSQISGSINHMYVNVPPSRNTPELLRFRKGGIELLSQPEGHRSIFVAME